MPTLLRPVADSDLHIFYEQQLDPEASAMAVFPSRNKEAFDAHWAKIRADQSVTLRTIIHEGQVAGNIVSWEQAGEREVGYWLGREFWGKGIATEALRQFLEIVPTRPLWAYAAKTNIASRRVLEKCGFTVIGDDSDGFILKLNE
jgi:RimJ/RimL family protein N-acetyltransferase